MTRTDAFLYAVKKVVERQRAYIDSVDVRSIQIHITLDHNGKANVVMTPRTEETVIGCYEGNTRVDRYQFGT